jgi:3-oxoacyl-[acyl-carrier protein] reductase
MTARTAVVTGTAHGIGAGIASALGQDGTKVHRVDKDTADLTSPAADVSDEEWGDVVAANLTTTFLCTRAVVPGMKERGWGRVVNISSAAGLTVSKTGIQAYTSAKAAVIGFTRQMAHELGPAGITVNCIAPGFILSNPTTEAQWQAYGPDGQRRLLEGIATRRLGHPQDIANGVLFFASDRSDWVTGQIIAIDGGSALL